MKMIRKVTAPNLEAKAKPIGLERFVDGYFLLDMVSTINVSDLMFSLCVSERELYQGSNIRSEDKAMNTINLFRLNGVLHGAVEDPQDGYRSFCSHVIRFENVTKWHYTRLVSVRRVALNFFVPLYVKSSVMKNHQADETEDYRNKFTEIKKIGNDDSFTYCVVRFDSEKYKQAVLEVGTNWGDDWYPSFVFNFIPLPSMLIDQIVIQDNDEN